MAQDETPKTLCEQDSLAGVCARGARAFVGQVEQRTGARLWDKGLGEVAEAFIVENGVPTRSYSATDLARAIGLLPKRRRLR